MYKAMFEIENPQDPLIEKKLSSDDLQTLLSSAGIDTTSWGKESASKSIADLLSEIESGEISLELIRVTSVVRIDVRYVDRQSETTYQLYEDRQEHFKNEMPVKLREELNDWEIEYSRNRCSDDNQWAIWEKQKPGESYTESALRAIKQEELKLQGDIKLVSEGDFEYIEPPIDYPGLKTDLKGSSFTLFLTPQQYDSMQEGYTEVQDKKQSVFMWKKII